MESAISSSHPPAHPPAVPVVQATTPFVVGRARRALGEAGSGAPLRLTPGESLFSAGEAANGLFHILDGTVMVLRLLPGNRRQIFDVAGRGRMIGFSSGAVHDCDAVALTRATVTSAGRSPGDHPDAMLFEIARLRDLATLLGRKTAIERIASFLVGLIDEEKDPCAVVLPLSRQDIADHLGLVIETVCRNLRLLKQQGLIALDGNHGVVLRDPEALRRMASGKSEGCA
jgi:CRP-like cAMP-binding protein